ncbi:MAG: hypothetical protein J6V70_00920 [Kiritimatiellae bacterium]|nr:hypothetical protein [Kiritimatiellia bacterium]
MLKKLLKYDFKSVFKYWWIAAVICFTLAIVGGFSIYSLTKEPETPDAITLLSILGLLLVILGFAAFILLSGILVFVRFYKNFFTDEGYLTFTLPVSRLQLLNSKLITSVSTLFLTGTVCTINILTMFGIALHEIIFTEEFWNACAEFFISMQKELGLYTVVYIIEILALIIVSMIFSSLFLFCCITFASIITKKAKVLVAIGIYYVANSVFSFVLQIFILLGLPSLMAWTDKMSEYAAYPLITVFLLGIIFFLAVFCAILYILQYWMIDRKLNLN